MAKQAYFITLEGGEASGKSTNLALIKDWLNQENIPHIITHEPGGTPLAEAIRNLLLHAEGQEKMSEEAELLLMFASRAQHVKNVIAPALAEGKWVICSRFTDSSYAYQGGGRGIDAKKIAILEEFVHKELQPDLTFLLDLPVAIAFERSKKRSSKDRIEQESHDFFERVRRAYLQRAQNYPERFQIVDAALPLESVNQTILAALKKLNNSKVMQ